MKIRLKKYPEDTMRTEGKLSKVAICPQCNGLILAGHIDFLNKQQELQFTQLTNEGFTIFLETLKESQRRKFSTYKVCKAKQCEPPKH